MSHVSKIVSLAAALLVSVGGVSLAGPPDPTKQISPPQLQTTPQVAANLPDLVPVVKGFTCSGQYLKMTLGVRNQGNAKTTVAVKTLVKINGQAYVNPDNPHTTNAEMWPDQWQEFHINGPKPAPQGPYVLQMEVDYEKKQPESKENNNVANATCRP